MSGDFFIPIINDKKMGGFTPLINFAEAYFNFGTHCYKLVCIKINGTIVVTKSQLPEEGWVHTILKIASMVITLGIFPLIILIIKFLYRTYHSVELINPLSISSFENQPAVILHKIFMEFFPPLKVLQYTVLNKHFNVMINNDLIRWENIYKEITEEMSKEELDAFIHRIKVLYTHGEEPSIKQKVEYLCQELWEDARQIPEIKKIIQNENLTINHLTNKNRFSHFKILVQPFKDKNLIKMIERTDLTVQDQRNYMFGDQKEKANVIRHWFNLEKNTQELMKITIINLSRSFLTFLSTEMLAYMARMLNLKTLDLGESSLTALPKAIGILTQLQNLNLQRNDISSIPDTLGNMTQLQSLYLQRNQLFFIPSSLGNLKQLQVLRLDSNHLFTFPDSICNMNQLKHLTLTNNRLSSISNHIENLKQLQILHLDDNQLSYLPDVIGNLKQLETFHLQQNQLISLPETIGKLNQLRRLSINNNQLSSLPDTIGGLEQLHSLFIDNNRFFSLPETIGNLKQLQVIRLDNDKRSLLPKAVENLKQLRMELY